MAIDFDTFYRECWTPMIEEWVRERRAQLGHDDAPPKEPAWKATLRRNLEKRYTLTMP
jgi:hypothetical protein